MTVIRILFAAVFVWFVCLGAGDLLFRALGLKFRRRERIFLAFLTGAALVSTGMFLLAAATLVYTKVVVILGLAIVGVWIWRCRPDFRSVTGLGPAPVSYTHLVRAITPAPGACGAAPKDSTIFIDGFRK